MKKILSIILVAALTFGFTAMPTQKVKAQNVMTATKNTHTNADTSNHVLKVIGNYDIVTVQLYGTKTSGTPAGTALLQGSLDGTNYETIKAYPPGELDSAAYKSGSLYGSYTITNTTGTQVKSWTLDHARFVWYRVRIITSGTQVSVWSARLLNRGVN